MPAALPVLIATTVRRLALVYGIGPGLDRQVVAGLARSAGTVGLLMRTALPLPALGLVVLGARLIARVALGSPLIVIRARLIIAALSLMPVWLSVWLSVLLPVTGAGVLRTFIASLFFGQHLAADTHAKQANCSQSPDVRFHAVSRGGIGRIDKTGKPRTGSAKDYQLRAFFSDNKKGRPVGRPMNFSVLAPHS